LNYGRLNVEDLVFAPIVFAFGYALHQVILKHHPQPFERKLLTRSFIAHLAAGIGLILVYSFYYEGGDIMAYHLFGLPISDAIGSDPTLVLPEVWNLFVHQEYRLPIEPLGRGSTGTMQAITVVIMFLFQNSLYATALFLTVLSYLSKVMIYRSLRSDFHESLHEKVLFASVLSPTAIVWTSAILKEPIIMICLGPAMIGLKWLLEGRKLPTAFALVFLASSVILLTKPYVLIALALSGGVWIFWGRTLRSGRDIIVKPAYFVISIAVVILGFTVISKYVPNLSPDKVAETMQQQRRVSSKEAGGSNFYLDGPDGPGPAASTSIASQLALAPLAVATALFRPVIFESASPLQFLNAIEMTWLTILFVQMIRKNGWLGVLNKSLKNPALMFSLVFVLVIAIGTGLSTANLGTLSRYRAPMMPFFLLMLLILQDRVVPGPTVQLAPAGPKR
jgi:hypothetical protein